MLPSFINPLVRYARFSGYSPAIPALYWNVYSAEQRIHALCKELDKLICYVDATNDKSTEAIEAINALIKEFINFKEHGFDDYYYEQIEEWINGHLPELLHMLIRQVYFGLTLDGHFVAYVPESWNDIVFDTGHVYGEDTYGRLILRWDADSPYTVEQYPREYNNDTVLADIASLNQFRNDVMVALFSEEDTNVNP